MKQRETIKPQKAAKTCSRLINAYGTCCIQGSTVMVKASSSDVWHSTAAGQVWVHLWKRAWASCQPPADPDFLPVSFNCILFNRQTNKQTELIMRQGVWEWELLLWVGLEKKRKPGRTSYNNVWCSKKSSTRAAVAPALLELEVLSHQINKLRYSFSK